MILFSIYRYFTYSDFQFLIIYMLGIFSLVYMVYEFQMKTRKRLFKELMETLQDDSRGKEGEMWDEKNHLYRPRKPAIRLL